MSDHATKRARLDSSASAAADKPSDNAMLDWLSERGVAFDRSEIVFQDGRVVAQRALSSGSVVARIDKSQGAILSPQTVAPAVRDAVRARGLHGGLALSVALWLERVSVQMLCCFECWLVLTCCC